MKAFRKITIGLAVLLIALLAYDGGVCQFRQRLPGRGRRVDRQFPGRRGQIDPPATGNPTRAGGNLNRRQRLRQEMVRKLGLTDSQQTKLRGIARDFNEPFAEAGRRARLSRRALDDAILAAPNDEARINRLADEWATAQAQVNKLQALRRAALRRVLTPEQMLQMQELEKDIRRQRREQRVKEEGSGSGQ